MNKRTPPKNVNKSTEGQQPVPETSSDLYDVEALRDLISSRDDNSRARIHSKAGEIRAIALSDEEGRLALYLVHAEGSV